MKDKMKRLCPMCGEPKEETEFYYHKRLNKYGAYCRNCNKLYQREYKRIYRERKRLNGENL